MSDTKHFDVEWHRNPSKPDPMEIWVLRKKMMRLTQPQFARVLGISFSHFAKVECGERFFNPRLKQRFANLWRDVAEILGKTPDADFTRMSAPRKHKRHRNPRAFNMKTMKYGDEE